MRSFLFTLSAIAAAAASPTTSHTTAIPTDANPIPDALDLDFLRDVRVPTYTTISGSLSQVVPYVSQTAIASASVAQAETPLSVFPAVSTAAINAAGDDNSTATATPTAVNHSVEGAYLQRRTACATQATIANYYTVAISAASAFRADPTIASVANNAPTPSGYFQNFKNAPGANNAYAYLGYDVLETGYDVNKCAAACSAKSGCLAFNIYFERDPILEPGPDCPTPDAFANIKCSFWGSALDNSTAINYGQWRETFEVAIAGSNGYTSNSIGGPIQGWDEPLKLNNAVMNAPLRDCSGTWTYLGYKLFQSGPFDVNLCAAACDAQTQYNIDNPPSGGQVVKCAAFGTYLLTKTNSTGSYSQGQMCTMYTSAWDAEYAVNTEQFDDAIATNYTFSYSFFYSKPDTQPICTADVDYLQRNGASFCSSYISYDAPQTTQTVTITPSGFVTRVVTATQSGASYATDLQRRATAIPTPGSIAAWPASKVSAACSQVATGNATVTATVTAALLTTTLETTATPTPTAP